MSTLNKDDAEVLELFGVDERGEPPPETSRQQHRTAAVFYKGRGSQSAQRWTLAFTILFVLFIFIGLGVGIAYGIPYWPTVNYGYGYLLGLLNWVTWPVYLAVGTYRNQELTETAVILCGLQWIVNVVVTLVQLGGAMAGSLNLNVDTNAYGVFYCIILVPFNTVLLFTLLYLVLGARRWLSTIDDELFNQRSALTGLRWVLIFALLLALWSLIALAIALMFNIPAWPASTYAYGYSLGTLNYLLWILYLATAILRLKDLVTIAFAMSLVELAVNMIVFVFQVTGLITNLINLSAMVGLFGLLSVFGPLLFNVVIMVALLFLILGLNDPQFKHASPITRVMPPVVPVGLFPVRQGATPGTLYTSHSFSSRRGGKKI
jgi:hypothetical protein